MPNFTHTYINANQRKLLFLNYISMAKIKNLNNTISKEKSFSYVTGKSVNWLVKQNI